MSDQDDFQQTVSVGGDKPAGQPDQIGRYQRAIANVFEDGTEGAWLLEQWLDLFGNPIVKVGDPYVTHARAGVMDFLLEIKRDKELASHVRRNT